MVKVLISTIYEGKVTPIVVYKLSPEKLILLSTEHEIEERKRAIQNLKEQFGKLLQIEVVKTDQFDVPRITRDVVKIINAEKGNEIYLHVSEGRKTMMLGSLFASYLAKDDVKAVYYVRDDTNELIPLPLLDFQLSKTKDALLRELENGNKNANDLAEKLKVHRSIIYVHIKNLIKKGYLTEEWDLTPSGKLLLLR